MENSEEFEKLKQLIYSGDETNIELALTIGGALGTAINEWYKDIEYLSDTWGYQLRDLDGGYTVSQFLNHIKKNGFLAGGIAGKSGKEPFSPKFARIAPRIKDLQFWYVSYPTLPDNIEIFNCVERFRVGSGALKELPQELWQIPTLKSVHIRPAKQFQWSNNILEAKNLEHLGSESLHIATLPSCLAQMSKLNAITLRAYGSPTKDATLPPAVLWECKGLKSLELTGKPYLYVDEEFKKLPLLENLALEELSNWEQIPESLASLHHLHTLKIINCRRIKSLPQWFSHLSINTLELRKVKLKNAFEVISKMPKLSLLILDNYYQKQADKTDWQAVADNVFFL